MTETATTPRLYDDYGRYLGTPYEQRIVYWMAEHHHPEYRDNIRNAGDHYMETISDAGRYWMHCEFTRESLDKTNTAIKEAFEAATDRYEDWASD